MHAAKDQRRYRVLFADDDQVFRHLVCAQLMADDFVVLLAKDGASAMASADREQLDVIILDYSMPGMYCEALIEALRGREHCAHVPILVLTSHADNEIVRSCLRAGATDYVVKTGSGDELVNRVRAAIEASESGEMRVAFDASIESVPDEPRVVLIVDNDPVFRRIVCADLWREGFTTVEAADGAAAMRALETEHVDAIVLDYDLPDLKGDQLLSQLKVRPESRPSVPVLLLTSFAEPDILRACLREGATDFIVKPSTGEAIAARVLAAIEAVPKHELRVSVEARADSAV